MMELPQHFIKDYGIIGDGHSSALVSRDGSIDWLCLPNVYNEPVFASLLDPVQGGCFAIYSEGADNISRRYLPDTAALETTFHTSDGVYTITDVMLVAPQREEGNLYPEREILRRIQCVEGNPRIHLSIKAVKGFNAQPLGFGLRGKLGWYADHNHSALYLLTDIKLQSDGQHLHGDCRLKSGEVRWCSLSCHPRNVAVIPPLGEHAQNRLEHTCCWWQKWTGQIHYNGPFREAVKRSAITIRLLTFPMSGALIAAATTSLPEVPGGRMNWDYRYCWPRDAAWAVMAFTEIGLTKEAKAFFDWLILAGRMTAPELNVMYDVYGRADVSEKNYHNWRGFLNSRPIRVGNALQAQRQLDVYGEVTNAISHLVLHHDYQLSPAEKRLLQGFGKVICRQWEEPDHGIWEIRGERFHYTFSKVQAWAVMDCLIKLTEDGTLSTPLAHYKKIRQELRETIENKGYSRAMASYTGILQQENLDASLLLMPSVGYCNAEDARMVRTWRSIHKQLDNGDLIYRYSPGFAGQSPTEGAFVICSFWAVDYLAKLGEIDEAKQRMQHLLCYANDLMLFSEEVDPHHQRLLGNFPQTFSHTGVIKAAVAIEKAEKDRRRCVA